MMEGKSIVVSVTPTLDTNIYASGDQLCTANVLTAALDNTKGTGAILSVIVLDKQKRNAAMEILFFNSEPTIASAVNAALDISDSEMAAKFLGKVSVAGADYIDLLGCSVCAKVNVGILLQGVAGSRDLYMVLQSKGTPTYAASDLVIKVGILQD